MGKAIELFLAKAKLILGLIPQILAAVQALEAAIPLPKTGADKLNFILSVVHQIYETEQQIQGVLSGDQAKGLIAGVVSGIVTLLNTLGIFKKS